MSRSKRPKMRKEYQKLRTTYQQAAVLEHLLYRAIGALSAVAHMAEVCGEKGTAILASVGRGDMEMGLRNLQRQRERTRAKGGK